MKTLFFKFCFYLLSDLGTSHVWNCWNMSDLWSCWHQLTWLFLCLGLGQIITLSADAQTSSCTYLVRYIIPAFILTTSDVFKKYYVLESNTDISTKKRLQWQSIDIEVQVSKKRYIKFLFDRPSGLGEELFKVFIIYDGNLNKLTKTVWKNLPSQSPGGRLWILRQIG